MTKPMMDLRELVEKSGEADLLREMIGFAAERLMELEVGGQTGAAYGEKSPELPARPRPCGRELREEAMHDVRTRMEGLHHLLTGGTGHPTGRRASPPRHLWGDLGLPEGRPRSPRRSLPARLLRW